MFSLNRRSRKENLSEVSSSRELGIIIYLFFWIKDLLKVLKNSEMKISDIFSIEFETFQKSSLEKTTCESPQIGEKNCKVKISEIFSIEDETSEKSSLE